MNNLTKHLIEVCKRNRVEPTPTNLLTFLEELEDEDIIEILNGQSVIDATIRYGLIEIDEDVMPPGLTIRIKDYDVQAEEGTTIQKDETGIFYLHEFHRSK